MEEVDGPRVDPNELDNLAVGFGVGGAVESPCLFFARKREPGGSGMAAEM